jgi:hypothetical protein
VVEKKQIFLGVGQSLNNAGAVILLFQISFDLYVIRPLFDRLMFNLSFTEINFLFWSFLGFSTSFLLLLLLLPFLGEIVHRAIFDVKIFRFYLHDTKLVPLVSHKIVLFSLFKLAISNLSKVEIDGLLF